MGINAKIEKLEAILSRYPELIVAYSGGVDSTLLLSMAQRVLGKKVVAVTAQSPLHPSREIQSARELTATMGIRHRIITSREMQRADFLANPKDRCYICKKNLLADIIDLGHRIGIVHVVHGANMDDLDDFRPGMQAARELSVEAPLLEAGLKKDDIRLISRQLDLPTWDKPALACLATRIPYGVPITRKRLEAIDAAEEYLLALGITSMRVRHHGDIARIEMDPDDFTIVLSQAIREAIVGRLRQLGFKYVVIDLEGYTSGSMNRA